MAKKKKFKVAPEVDYTQEDLEYIRFKMNPGDPSLISASPIPYVDYSYTVDIRCKNQKQKQYLNLLKDESKQIIAALGEPGTGKSWISLAYGLQCIKTGKFKKIVCFNPTVPAGSKSLDVGFLPGDLSQKMSPYLEADKETMQAILEDSGNAMPNRIIDGLIRNHVIDHKAINFCRGKSINNALILLNECQNYTISDIILILTRLGQNSKICLSGDIRQADSIDVKKGGRKKSILEVVERLQGMPEFGLVEFEKEDIVRNPLIAKILELLDPLDEKITW